MQIRKAGCAGYEYIQQQHTYMKYLGEGGGERFVWIFDLSIKGELCISSRDIWSKQKTN